MKTKVLKYANNGNDLVNPYMELTQLFNECENAFYTPLEGDYYWLVFKCQHEGNTVYVATDSMRLTTMQQNKEAIIDHASNLFAHILNFKWIGILWVELFKQLGKPTDELLALRNAQIAAREERRANERAEQEAKELAKAEEAKAEAAEIKTALANGEKVTYASFLFAVDYYKFAIHPRTKGSINKQNSGAQISLSTGEFTKKTSNSTAQSIFEAVKSFAFS